MRKRARSAADYEFDGAKRRVESPRTAMQQDDQDEPDNAFNAQPGSGAASGGVIGAQEFGVAGQALEEGHRAHKTPASDQSGLALDRGAEPYPYGEVEPGFPGVSEWSAEQAVCDENDIVIEHRHINRTDEQIVSDLIERLEGRRTLDLSRVVIRSEHGKVVLSGVVRTHAMRLDIEEVAESIPGVKEISDQIVVE